MATSISQISRACLALLILPTSCSASLALDLYYDDPLIEAPARTVNIHLLKSTLCEDVMSRPHAAGTGTPEFIKGYNYSYPVIGHSIPVEDLENNDAFTVAVEIYDRQLTSVARGCLNTSQGEVDTLKIALLALPDCQTIPTEIDLSLVIDTSSPSREVDERLLHLDALKRVFLEKEVFSSWTIISTGGTPKLKTVANDSETETEQIISELSTQYNDPKNQLFDGIALAAKTIRARALCGRVPAVFVYSSGPDSGSVLILQNAHLGLIGSSLNARDNIYTVGFALEQQGFSEMVNIIPENSGSYILGMRPELLEQQFFEAREELQALVP